jgi:hypothetical protein
MLKENIAKILGTGNVLVKKNRNDFVSGTITQSDNKKKSTFYLSWGDDYIYLRIKGDDVTLLKIVSEIAGTECVKGKCRSWTGMEIMYAWHKKEDGRKEFLNYLQLACRFNTGLFSFLGWKEAELIRV